MKMSTNQTSNNQNSKLTKSNTTPNTTIVNLKAKNQQIIQSPALISNYSDEDSLSEETNSDKFKSKLLTYWNNIKYGWTVKIKPTFNLNNNEPIWLLGICYMKSINPLDKKQLFLSRQVILNDKAKQNLEVISLNEHPVQKNNSNLVIENQSNTSSNSSSTSSHSSPNSSELDIHSNDLNIICSTTCSEVLENFKHDFYSRIWMTYRRDFKKIPGSQFTSDCGWGCMIRSGQSLLAQAFLCHYLQRNWRFTGAKSDKEDMIHRMLIKWFADEDNSIQSPFSIHQLVKCGMNLGKKPGDWYGPSSVAYIMKNALEAATNESNFVLDSITIYVAQDCTIYLKDLIKLCNKKNQPSKYKSLSALKKDKTNHNSNHYTTINGAMFLNGNGQSYLKSRKRIRSSLKSLGSSIDLASEQLNKQKDTISDKNNCFSSSSAESNITSRNNSVNQSIDDVFTNSVSNNNNLIDSKSSSSFNLNTALLNGQLKEKNLLSTTSSSSSNSSTRSTKVSSIKNKNLTGSTILNELKKSNKKTKFKSVIILIPLRLGGEKFNSIYTNCIKKLFKSPYCLGIIGGRPNHSLYFVGYNEDKLIYLDPHFCQPTVNTDKTNFPLNSYHCSTPRKLQINRMDPSCTIGFYCHTEQDLNNLIEFSRKEMVPSRQRKLSGGRYPIFIFDEVNSVSNNNSLSENLNNSLNETGLNNNFIDKDCKIIENKIKDKLVKVRHQYLAENGIREIESDDFVLL